MQSPEKSSNNQSKNSRANAKDEDDYMDNLRKQKSQNVSRQKRGSKGRSTKPKSSQVDRDRMTGGKV